MRWLTPFRWMTVATTLFVGPAVASAQNRPPSAPTVEMNRLRGDLDRLNAQIADLKRGGRGLRDDFRLRRLMADSEALARQLTDAEARLRGPVTVVAPPVAVESAGVLEAKADILEDQSNHLNSQADSFLRAATQVKTRQRLRQRAGQFDRDPFAGLDASKRSMIIAIPNAAPKGIASGPPVPGQAEGSARAGLAPPVQPPAPAADTARASAPMMGAAAAPPAAGSPSAGAPALLAPSPGATTPSAESQAPPTMPTPTMGVSAIVPTAPAPVLPSFSTQSRTVIDPATAADLRRFDAGGAAPTDPAALERMATALRLRAQSLAGQARDLRTRARAH